MDSKQSRMQRLFGHKPARLLERYDYAKNGPAVWEVGDVILGMHKVTGILGEGGMGSVYKIYERE
ncbi:hypothetical protein KSC_031750 [Ktedonobacter sp. SOSP1-52]|uniref:hypothetical protein n=1 Tax=Ktedonobacter sp. SOSP1-52 TaxID=2778366 RepID=UPI001A2BFC99|nr:hypothetical protein [Ktedonobacter sp. SOSP1-52]GHO64283.1 hypothetical protein KSC_031750 [Ktedonobacter sp. SOSP1-52]